MTLQEMLDKRNKAITECRRIDGEITRDKGGVWSAEARSEFDKWQGEVVQWNTSMKELGDDQNRAKWLADQEREDGEPATGRRTDAGSHGGTNPREHGKERRVLVWDGTSPWNEVSESSRMRPTHRKIVMAGERASSAYHKGFCRYLNGSRPENAFKGLKNYQPDPAMEGETIRSDDEERAGYFIASEEFMAGLLRNVDDEVYVQSMSRVLTTRNARSLGIRKRTAKASCFNWGSELTDVTNSLENSLRFGNRTLTPHYLVGAVRISRDLIRFASEDIQSLVLYEIGINLRELLELAYLFGDGVEKPLGLMVNNAEGITSARDLNSTISTTAFTFDDWQALKYNLKLQYRSKARWMIHRNILATLAALKASNTAGDAGSFNYLWEPSRQVGEPDRILGLPYIESEWMPHTPGAGLYYTILGDFSHYLIAFGMELEVNRLVEIAARTNEVEYHLRLKVDAMPDLEEAFTRGAYKAA